LGKDHAQTDNLARRELSLASAVESGNSNGIARYNDSIIVKRRRRP
jgi:hypothetical protein